MLYREAGPPAQPTVLLLHGMTGTSWNITDLMRALVPTFHVLAPDHVGAGLHAAPTPLSAEDAVAGMSAHLVALMRQLNLTTVATIAQDIAACITSGLLAGGRAHGDIWAVAVEDVPAASDSRFVSLRSLVPADQSPFAPTVHALLASHEHAIAQARQPLSTTGTPTVSFHALKCSTLTEKRNATSTRLRLLV